MTRRRHRLASTFFLAATLLVGCPDDAPPGNPDANLPPPELQIGSGGLEAYVPVDDGDTVELARGCQGGQHVWIGLRAKHIETEPALVTLAAVRVSDEEMVSIPITVRLRFEQGHEWDEIRGLQLIIPDPDDVLTGEVDIRARVAEDLPGGLTVESVRRVNVVWGDEVCGAFGDGGLDGDAGEGHASPDGGIPDAAATDS